MQDMHEIWPQNNIKASSYLRGRIGWQGLRADEFIEDGPYLITGTDFVDGRVNWSTCYHVTDERYEEGAYIHIKNRDLLITKDGTIGKVVFVDNCPEKAVLNSGVFLLRCVDGSYDHRYMYHILKSRLFQDFLDDNLAGSTINHLYQHVFQKFVFPIPGLDEQRQIAEYLDFIVAAIDQTSTIISKEVCIKTGLMRELLTKGIDEHGQLRSEATHPFVDTPLGRLPASWKTASVEELLAEVDPAMRSGPFGSALLKSELVEEGVPLLGIDNVLSEEFVPTFTRFVSARKAKKLERYRVRPNDVMITIMGTVGRSCVVPCNIGQVLSSKHVWTLSFNEDVCSPLLASYQFNHAPWVKSHFLREEQGGVMSAIRSDTLRSTLFPVPPPEEMRLIEGVLVKLNCSLAKKSAEFRKLQGLRAGLLRDLLSGKVRVPVARGEEQQPVQAVA